MRPAAELWQAVGYAGDPVPGDPDVVAVGGRDYLDVADAIRGAKSRLDTIDLDGQISQAVDALMDAKGKVADDIGKAEARYRAAGQALVAYAPVLSGAQQDSATALYRAHAAVQASDTASADHQRYLSLAQSETDPASALRYTNLAQQAEGDATDASGTLSAAKQQIDAAASTRDRAAESAISQIREITDHDGLKDSWWDNWGKSLLEKITDIAGIVASIAGMLALVVAWIPVVGQALAAALLVITAAAALVDAIGNTILAATGDRSWTTAIISIVGAALACIGLGGPLRVLATAGKEGLAVTRTATTAARDLDEYEAAAARINRLSEEAPKRAGTEFDTVTADQLRNMDREEFDEVMRLYQRDIPEVQNGTRLFRLYSSDPEGSAIDGASFTADDPGGLLNPRAAFGLPNTNTADRLVEVEVTDASRLAMARRGLPYSGQPGGASEYIFLGKYSTELGDYLPEKGLTIIRDGEFTLP
ncbi:MAG TPA: hypothetical protein VGC45_14075 [Gryllotalpicola sp.]